MSRMQTIKMINRFKWIFPNRFVCGWVAGILLLQTIQIFNLYHLWEITPICAIFYTTFRYMAFKYLDE